jgi:glycosyltransferase involved in cell wall biosynthesis
VTNPRLLHIKGAGFGGDSVLILELGRAAKEQGFQVDVLASDPRFQEMILEAGLGLVDLDVIRREIRPVRDTRALAALMRLFSRSSYSIVHTHTSKPGILGRLAARRSGVPAIIHTPHLFPFHEESGRLSAAAYVRCERLAARWCDRIVAVSEFHREWALQLGIGRPGQVISIPNGVPAERTVPTSSSADVRRALGIGDAFMVFASGRLAPQKGIEYLVRAAPRVREAIPGARIVVAGDGPLEDRLAQLSGELGVEDTMQFIGFRADIAELLGAADLVVLPSLWEGLSISLLEAMAAAKPIVTTTLGSNREVTNDGAAARLVPPKDVDALAAAIVALAEAPDERDELARRGQAIQRERYTMEPMLDAYLAEYDRLLAHARVAGPPQELHVVESS